MAQQNQEINPTFDLAPQLQNKKLKIFKTSNIYTKTMIHNIIDRNKTIHNLPFCKRKQISKKYLPDNKKYQYGKVKEVPIRLGVVKKSQKFKKIRPGLNVKMVSKNEITKLDPNTKLAYVFVF
eukprot:TRINITY_DN12502_c0_g1_i1.p1 TRINITY_DN12502_c0_g1~~TRINITY_DN12502_c0_g1_i1.p1  ORF type:complete len:123 (+),score=15.45 TRINITY_DN12502_c0_g1_i1:85-453(+)